MGQKVHITHKIMEEVDVEGISQQMGAIEIFVR